MAFLPPQEGRESYQCTVQKCESTTCPESASVCTATKGCFNEIQRFGTPSSATNQMFKQKGCSKDTCSELEFSATLGAQRRFSFVNRCCTSDNCNKGDLTLPQASEEANGIQCLAYYEEPGTQSILSFLNCTGNETKCVAVIGTAAGSSHPFAFVIAGMGCATESACNKSMTVLNSTNILTFCSSDLAWSSVPDSTGLRPASISTVPMLIVLLLLKVLL
ncbi:protein RoBo-1-like [Arvicola amphibius]|uniref:protein RoBo-1-like n=1 Tax=Arvicola amphibius TaxID=1047088 RepID=UPI001C0A20A0|nr:protein RoBo-1-like [Arvicola amphibius]